MSEWLKLKQEMVRKTKRSEHHGDVEIELFMSPYDVPEAVRGRYDKQLDRFVVEFRYIAEEPTRREDQDDNIALRVGKNSSRLYAIEINTKALQAKSVSVQVNVPDVVENAIASFARQAGERLQGNLSVAKEAVEREKQRLFSAENLVSA